MATTGDLFVYFFLAAVIVMAGALYLWGALASRRLSAALHELKRDAEEAAVMHEAARLAADRQLRSREAERAQELATWTGEFQKARDAITRLKGELAEVRDSSLKRWTAFRHMQEVWGDNDDPTNEAAAKELLREHMWVLEPEYKVVGDRKDWEVNLTNALRTLYGTFAAVDNKVWRTPPDLRQLVDIAAVVSMDGVIGLPRTHAGDEALLLIEAKRPGPNGVLNEAARDQVLSYAADLRKIAPEILMGRRIECLLVGGRIPDRMNDIVVKWDSEGEAPTIVRFLTWQTLLKRAERACELAGPRPAVRHQPEPLAHAAQ
jgi:hypothetical protein